MTSTSQVTNGKAFEYAVAQALHRQTGVQIRRGPEYEICKRSFEIIGKDLSIEFDRAAIVAIDHIIDLEESKLKASTLHEIWIAPDARGQRGDVRDVILEMSDGAIGISCKNNHSAFKHSRLSGRIDFVKKWGLDPRGCSEMYWGTVKPIFLELEKIKKDSNGTARWTDLPNIPSRFYWPVLDAFENEILRLTSAESKQAEEVSRNLVAYVVGNVDFYKVIRRSAEVTIQGFNFNATLSTNRTRGPSHVIAIDRLDGGQYSKTVRLNRGFTFNFRIHNASSRVEPSLKFDIQAVSLPETEIYINHLRLTTN